MDARTMRSAAKLMEQMALARVNKAGVQIMPRMRWDCELAPGAGSTVTELGCLGLGAEHAAD